MSASGPQYRISPAILHAFLQFNGVDNLINLARRNRQVANAIFESFTIANIVVVTGNPATELNEEEINASFRRVPPAA